MTAPSMDTTTAGTEAPPVPHELARVHRALKTLSEANRALLRAHDEEQLLNEMCRVAVEEGGYRMAWASYAEHDEQKTVRPVAHYGFEDSFLSIRRTWSDAEERGHGPNASAIRTKQPVVVRDVAKDEDYAFWRDEAAKRGYASVIGLPLIIDGEVFGALSIYAREPDAFDAAEVELLTDLAEDLSYGIGALRARAKQKDAEETIRRMAYYDALTGLPNRAKLKIEMQQAIAAARKQNRPFPLLILDLDRFSEINEGLGYAEGDRLLQQVGQRLQSMLDSGEMLAHLGEDEFAILIPRGDAEYAQRAARRALKALETPFELSGFKVDMRASIGIALFPGHGSDPDALILRAESAMARTKRSNSDYTVYTGGPGREHTRRLALIRDLNHAIREHQLLLYCQPKVDIPKRRVCGAEALVRWRHPELGMISLSELIPLAEQTGQIKPLTYWMVDAALRQCHAWSEEGYDLPLAVNVSVRNLREPAFLDRISGLLQTWGTGEGLFQLELTESALMEDPAGALEVLNRLHAMGIELNVDDFGTGYSSLSYLERLPVDTIKIDQSFVRDMVTSGDAMKIVRSTIDLAHNLDMKVIAEGVEQEAIWNHLATLNCDMAQGYYISKPIPADEIKAWQQQSPWRPLD